MTDRTEEQEHTPWRVEEISHHRYVGPRYHIYEGHTLVLPEFCGDTSNRIVQAVNEHAQLKAERDKAVEDVKALERHIEDLEASIEFCSGSCSLSFTLNRGSDHE